MEQQGTGKRKLAAILSADVAGYSRLMGADEHATVHRLTAYRAVFADSITQHAGPVVDTAGGSGLGEPASGVEGGQCAGEVPPAVADQNAQLPETPQVEFRI